MDKIEEMLRELEILLDKTSYYESSEIRNALARYIDYYSPGPAAALSERKEQLHCFPEWFPITTI